MRAILKREGVLRPPRSPLAFPGSNPGVNASHTLASSILFSGVASDGGTFTNLLNGTVGTKNGTPTTVINSLGRTTRFSSSGSDNATFPSVATNAAGQTMAVICMPDAVTSVSIRNLVSTAAGGSTGLLIALNNTSPHWSFSYNGNFTSIPSASLPDPVAGRPYFYAVSISSAALVVAVLRDLQTGQIYTYSTTTAVATTTSDAFIYIGNRGTNSRQALSCIPAAMHSTAFNSLPALVKAANDPWSFWYRK